MNRLRSLLVGGLILVGTSAVADDQIDLVRGDLGDDQALLQKFAGLLTEACLNVSGSGSEGDCSIDEARLYVGRRDLSGDGAYELLVAAASPLLCELGGCRTWVLERDQQDMWQTIAVGAVSGFVVAMTSESRWPTLIFGRYAGAHWESVDGAYQAFCISKACLDDFGVDERENAIEFPDPLRAGD